MAMEWTEETIARLRELWQQGLSTAEIGRQLAVTKNAVVGKAHRLGLQSRPSPIRRPPAPARAMEQKATTPTPVPAVAPVVASSPAAPTPVASPAMASDSVTPVAAAEPRPATVAPAVVAEIRPAPQGSAPPAAVAPSSPQPVSPAPAPATESKAESTVEARAATRPEPRAPLRAVTAPAPRRSGLTCCWPLGDPGTPGFHFCGGTPVPGKPYCAEHAQLAYVKLRDRRDNVA
ncbi:GcrA cell cycle regulator [Gluconacetobacter diazotrophicus PA1 5]|uniref:GcrA cell cycle regulator n=2 Tax=Gluconacetobacter diazotrophicus TaxID=33996 RepID=A0A7W4I677_GLUDI|nr:GcrA family cell cycle regulator [Gluconacetobacter diazotrophicus]ACI51091.1 GcrA cell cycle regulator [Gluconacetobacter diazotrophicus PA1 5]MBB2157007.1 GcrA cell cycle regulator [Gluconacetobacter diazotrophicus]TWB07634.1 GcrA cell cycle regulator [Gluconacetobacter diazotrophicus]CAP54643.1 putative GcrA cell cycle regulator [Gluconacetobacter diazotrophicus PA1 5]